MAKRRNPITGQWSARLIDMQRSFAWRVLSRAAHQCLSRIEIELADHGGNDINELPVTFNDFESYGVNRHAIGPALAELEALGFIEHHRARQDCTRGRVPALQQIPSTDAALGRERSRLSPALGKIPDVRRRRGHRRGGSALCREGKIRQCGNRTKVGAETAP
jgi:hypothetical protein